MIRNENKNEPKNIIDVKNQSMTNARILMQLHKTTKILHKTLA